MTGFEGDLHELLATGPPGETAHVPAPWNALHELPHVPYVPDGERLGPVTVTLAGVQPEHVSWLWPARLPLGKLVVLDGDPAVGKSTLAVDLAARISTGARWPDGTDCPTADVLIMSAEDGLADTIRPRLDAASGDAAKVHALTDVRYLDDAGQNCTRPPTLADAALIEQAIRRHGARLVIIDVLMAYLPGKVDSHRDQDIRSVLSALAAVAEATGCCILLLRHLNKAVGGNPLYRGGGSIGIVGAARAAFLAAVDPDDDGRRVLAATKSNLALMPEALSFRLVDSGNGCARVEWLGATGHMAGDLLGHREGDDERTERDEAAEWLLDYLGDQGGQAKAADAIKAAAADGIAKTTLTRARQRAGVTSAKTGMHGGWVWSADPRRIHEESEESTSHGLDSSVPSVDSSGPQIGPCTRCGAATRRYGDGADPLCKPCRAAS
ncbi:MAG: AAA family ATPase [Geodermatophilaceae bacterium]